MLQHLSSQITDIFVKNGLIENKSKPIYAYGLFLILSTIETSAAILILCALLGNVLVGVVFLVSMMSIRFFSGGYHASTYRNCFLLSTGLAVLVFLVSKATPPAATPFLSVVLVFGSAVYLFVKTPLVNANNPLSDRQIRKNRQISRVVLVVQVFIISLGTFFVHQDSLYFYTASVATFVVAILFFWGDDHGKGTILMKKKIFKLIAGAANKAAQFGAGSVSVGLTYQPKTPESLVETAKK